MAVSLAISLVFTVVVVQLLKLFHFKKEANGFAQSRGNTSDAAVPPPWQRDRKWLQPEIALLHIIPNRT